MCTEQERSSKKVELNLISTKNCTLTGILHMLVEMSAIVITAHLPPSTSHQWF